MSPAYRTNSQELLDLLMQAARAADWNSVEQLAELAGREPVPDTPGLPDHIRSLTEALIVAKAARADLQVSLARLTAAAGFSSG